MKSDESNHRTPNYALSCYVILWSAQIRFCALDLADSIRLYVNVLQGDNLMTDWPHAPPHRILENGSYIITAGTYKKEHLFSSSNKLDMLYEQMLIIGECNNINFNAWALMSNHYHVIISVNEPGDFKKFINSFHRQTAILLNKIDDQKGRKVWYNYWDTKLTYEKSYYSRLNYVNENPVHHNLVQKAEDYRWCSEAYFKYKLDSVFYKTVKSFKYDNIRVFDKF